MTRQHIESVRKKVNEAHKEARRERRALWSVVAFIAGDTYTLGRSGGYVKPGTLK